MKFFRSIATLSAAILLILGLSGCMATGPSELNEHALIGVWNWDESTLWQYTFEADGTGTRGFANSLQSFNWSRQGDRHIRISPAFFLH